MGYRPGRGWRAAVVAFLIAGLVGCSTAPAASSAVAAPAGPAARAAPAVRLLQLNLCNSGAAGCYTGRSVAEAAAAIRAEAPDLVTLNEVCHDDVAALHQALAAAWPGQSGGWAFRAARDARTGAGYRCRNGQEYGIGVVSRWAPVPGAAADGGIHPVQDPRDPEERAWLCLDAAASPPVAVCTTHLAYTDRQVALAQCRHLFGTVVAQRGARNGPPVVVGGDLNLGSGDGTDVGSCLPAGSARADDGGQQHVVATSEFVVTGARTVDLRGATDHPGLLVELVPRGGPGT